ncbi:MAG TPA: DUF350 domain-containing protein [Syntrophobacteraceae bacterium]|nr:DUF350 domain-containing protein [Syntrophobacteraceae bacterium]
MNFLYIIFQVTIYPLLGMLVVRLVKAADDRRMSFDEDRAMLMDSNLAVGLRKAGICLGLFLALAGVLSGKSPKILVDLLNFFEAAVMVVIFLFLTFELNKRIILRKVNNDEAVAKGNVAVGAVEFSTYVGTGIIMNGAFSGEGGGLPVAAAFFILGQIALVIAFYLDAAIARRNIQEEIELKGNIAEGIDIAGMLIAISIILRASIIGPFTGWWPGLEGFGIYLALGLIALFVFKALAEKIFMPRVSYAEEMDVQRNEAVAVFTASIQISVAVFIANSM